MPRRVRIVGDPEIYDVLCETPRTKVLVNANVRLRETVAAAEAALASARAALEADEAQRRQLAAGNRES